MVEVAWKLGCLLVDLVKKLLVLAVGGSSGVNFAVSWLLELLMDDVLLLLACSLELAREELVLVVFAALKDRSFPAFAHAAVGLHKAGGDRHFKGKKHVRDFLFVRG